LCLCLPAFEPHFPSRGHATPPSQLAVALSCRPSSRGFFLQVPLAVACRLSPWPRSTKRLWPIHCLFPLVVAMQRVPSCCSLFAFPTLPHLPSVLAGQQVVERCAGPGALVPRARCEHVVDMERCGYARVRNPVAQISQGLLSLLLAHALLQSVYPLSPYFALCYEACSTPCPHN
jgi:hypothetical protein